ncbi:MAG TPA: amidohydrolase [Chloroflexi bacterium]|jgi:predicted amidohydrolase YtcJ|nr:amidohydrolase [Chloroflexota bacterium]
MAEERVLLNGRIHTLSAAPAHATALVTRGERIVYVGDDSAARAMAGPGAEVIDLHGACVVPGLTDAHMHLAMFALGLQNVQAETDTLDECLQRVAAQAARTPAGEWVTGYGWNHNVWGGTFPTAALLDLAAPDHPVALSTKSGHATWVNSQALTLAGITADTPDPAGGKIVRDAQGHPTGVLLEEAMALVDAVIPAPTPERTVEAIRQALPVVHRAGLTAVHDMGSAASLRALQSLHRDGALTLRVLESIPLDALDAALALGLQSGFGDDRLRLGHVKMFMDGALGPRTALMLAPYEDAADAGIAVTDPAAIHDAVRRANAGGLACAVHAIGDRANRDILDIYERIAHEGVGSTPQKPLRNRIEHAQILHPDDVSRLGQLGIVASMQPIHATSDMDIAKRHLGSRCRTAYAWRAILDGGTVLALGSDCPVEAIDPLAGIHAAVTRRRADGSPAVEGWYPEQRLTVEQAVRGYTWGAAYAAGMEEHLGTLAPNKLADITILDRDLWDIDPMDILNVRVLGTIVGGAFVWRDAAL